MSRSGCFLISSLSLWFSSLKIVGIKLFLEYKLNVPYCKLASLVAVKYGSIKL